MNGEGSEFDTYVDLYDKIKTFKKNNSAEILKNFSSENDAKFNLTADETERLNLSSTAVCTYALTKYIKIWNENEKSERKAKFQAPNKYYDFICNGLKKTEMPETELLDEFSILNILYLLQKIQYEINNEKSKKSEENDEAIMQIIRALCKQFIENEFDFKENPHPFIYYKFLSMVEDRAQQILEDLKTNVDEWKKGEETGKSIFFINEIVCKYLFSMDVQLENDSNGETIPLKLAEKFHDKDISLHKDSLRRSSKNTYVILDRKNYNWSIKDKENNTYIVKEEDGKLNIYEYGGSKDAIFNFFYDRIYDNAKYDMYRQITFYYANDRTLFDVKRLIYSLLIVTKNDRYSNNLIKDKVLELIFNEQFDATGLLPIGHVVSNDFVIEGDQIDVREVSANPILSSVECFNDLLTQESLKTDLERYQDNFKLTYEWIMKRLRKSPDDRLLGWYPEYESTHTPESWVGGHTLLFLKNYCEMLSESIKKSAGKYLHYKEPKTFDITWDKLYDSYKIKENIEKYMGKPESDSCSTLIFGPPGSGKSTIPKALAEKLEWGYVELTPGVFLAKGHENIISEANNIFKRLIRMKNTVIFFDEVDELVMSRKEKDANTWIVTALLPKFAELWKQKEIKFILASNDITKIDSAVIRSGRIDLALPMGGICWKSRLKILKDVIITSNDSIKGDLISHIFGDTLWDKKVEEIDKNDIDTNELRKFLERTNFVPPLEIKEIIKELFKGNQFSDIKNIELFGIFFEGKGGIGNFENSEFKGFHNKLGTELYSNIKLPSKTQSEEGEHEKYIKEIIEGNIF